LPPFKLSRIERAHREQNVEAIFSTTFNEFESTGWKLGSADGSRDMEAGLVSLRGVGRGNITGTGVILRGSAGG